MVTKRRFDLLLALVLIGPALGICVIVAFLIFIEVRASPIFKQTRVGRDNRPFEIFKLRTMKPNTANVASHNVAQSQITRTGIWLRRLKFDELPQLYNVLNGTMSFVGPRPCLPSQHELLTERSARKVTSLLPGITGLGQLAGLDMSTPRELAIADADYVGAWSWRRDIKILFDTATGGGRGDAAIKPQDYVKSAADRPQESMSADSVTMNDRRNPGKTVVITGASGFIGQAVVPRLLADGWRVIALVRTPHSGFSPDVQQHCCINFVTANRNDLAAAMKNADCLIHLAAVVPGKNDSPPNGTVRIAKAVCEAAIQAGIAKIIVLSSVYATLAEKGDPNARTYGREKLEADQIFDHAQANAAKLVILRPPLVYGLGMSGALAKLSKMISAGFPLPLALAKSQRHYISKENLVDLIATVACAPDTSWKAAEGRRYCPTDGLSFSTADLVKAIAAAHGRTAKLIPVPLSFLRLAGRLTGLSEMLSGALDPLPYNDNAALQLDFGWIPNERMPNSLKGWICPRMLQALDHDAPNKTSL